MDDNTIATRPATIADVPQIVENWLELMAFHEGIDSFWTVSDDGPDNMAIHLQELIESDEAHVIVADSERGLVGFAVCMFRSFPPVVQRRSSGFISDLGVTARCRRKGIGSRLLEACLAWFRLKDTYRVELSVAAHNAIGCNFWRKHGFKEYLHVMRLELD